jgi:hypothetical protein
MPGPSQSLLITALRTRADANATPDLYARSLALVWLLKQYAHAISNRTNRGGYVDMDEPDERAEALLRVMGASCGRSVATSDTSAGGNSTNLTGTSRPTSGVPRADGRSSP